jgi:hypothetical protein
MTGVELAAGAIRVECDERRFVMTFLIDLLGAVEWWTIV